MTIFTEPPWQKCNWTSPVLCSIQQSNFALICLRPNVKKVCLSVTKVLGPLPQRSVCFMQPALLHTGLLNQTWVCHIVESRGCRLPSEEMSKYLEVSAGTLLLVSHSSWFSIKDSKQNARTSLSTQGEIYFTLLQPAKAQISHSKAAVYVASVTNWKREEHLVGKSAQFSPFLHEKNAYDKPGSEGYWSPKLATWITSLGGNNGGTKAWRKT